MEGEGRQPRAKARGYEPAPLSGLVGPGGVGESSDWASLVADFVIFGPCHFRLGEEFVRDDAHDVVGEFLVETDVNGLGGDGGGHGVACVVVLVGEAFLLHVAMLHLAREENRTILVQDAFHEESRLVEDRGDGVEALGRHGLVIVSSRLRRALAR